MPLPDGKATVQHEDLRDGHVEPAAGGSSPSFLSNYGPRISIYVTDLTATYQRVADLNIAYVNPRFKRRAYFGGSLGGLHVSLLDIVDPDRPEDGAILRLEHEVAVCSNKTGSMYKSCPFDSIPQACR
jgi:hypothetical protein